MVIKLGDTRRIKMLINTQFVRPVCLDKEENSRRSFRVVVIIAYELENTLISLSAQGQLHNEVPKHFSLYDSTCVFINIIASCK